MGLIFPTKVAGMQGFDIGCQLPVLLAANGVNEVEKTHLLDFAVFYKFVNLRQAALAVRKHTV